MNFGKCWKTVNEMVDDSRADSFLVELRTRSSFWLLFGKEPAISFESTVLQKTVEAKRPHELKTAKRLVRNGVPVRFVRDVYIVSDSNACGVKQVGMADLANGYELKTLENAATFSSIDGYLRRAAKKKNVVAVVFDNTDNQGMGDEILGQHIQNASRRFKGRVYVLGQDESYKRRK